MRHRRSPNKAHRRRLRRRYRRLFQQVEFIPSPNYSLRTTRSKRLGVLHATAAKGKLAGTIAWFKNPLSQCSSNHLIPRAPRTPGGWCRIILMVRLKHVAWTQRSANRHVRCSIELEADGNETREQWLAPANQGGHREQLRTLAVLIAELSTRRKPIPIRYAQDKPEGWCGHSDLTQLGWPQTHTDPGPGFPWDELIQWAKQAHQLKLRRRDTRRPGATGAPRTARKGKGKATTGAGTQ